MWLRRKIWVLVAIAIAIAAAGCIGGQRSRKGEPEMPLPPGVSEAPKGLKFSVKVTPTKFKLGDRVVLEATMFNDSEKKFEKSFKTSCAWDYEVATDVGRVVGPERACEPLGAEIMLEPGELRMIVREWSGNDRYFAAQEKLSPGFYKVTAGLIDEFQRVIPMADPVTVEIMPR